MGELAQEVERPLSTREAPGSMPGFSILLFLLIIIWILKTGEWEYLVNEYFATVIKLQQRVLFRKLTVWICRTRGEYSVVAILSSFVHFFASV